MIQAIKKFIFALRFKRAVKKADTLKHLTHRKHMVLVVNKRLAIHDIEKKAIYITL